LNFFCSRTCATETRSAHPRSLLQGYRAWLHLLRAVPVLLSHHWPSTCSRVVCCLARAYARGIEPSRPLTKHFRSHSRTRRFNSAPTSGSCNSAAFSSGSPRHNRFPASARTEACLHQDHTFRCHPRQATSVLHEQFAVPPDFVRDFLLNGLRRPSRVAPLLSPCRSALSRRAAAPRALSSAPAPSPTASPTPPHTCACAFPHHEIHAQARANRSTTRRRSRICTHKPALRRPARPPLLAHGSCTHRPRAAHAVACAAPRARQRLIPRAAHAARSGRSCSAPLAPASARPDASGACSPACALLRAA
jgi:hypothetical protein